MTLIGIVVLGAGLFGLWRVGRSFIEKTSWSNLETVQVVGTRRLSDREIISASKLQRNMNIMRLPLERVAAEVQKLPGVASAKVVRRLPRRVVIKIEERKPVAAIFKEQLWLLDETGALFPLASPREIVDVPVLSGDFSFNSIGLPYIKHAAKLAGTIRDGFPVVFDHLAEISLNDGRFGLRLQDGGARILAPDPTSPAALSKLEHFLQQKADQIPAGCEYVDLRYPAMVITGTEG